MRRYVDASLSPSLSPQQSADRLAIRELIDAYAFCADRRDAEGQMALFTEDTEFLVFMDSLNTYVATMHFNGQNTVTVDGDRATGVNYCLAHHVKVEGSGRSLMIAAI